MATSNLTPSNYFVTSLSAPVTTTDTVINLASVPTGSEGYLEIDEGLSTKEIVYFTSKGAGFVTLPSVGAGRGVGGTSAAAHSSGATVKMKLNAEWWLALQNGSALLNNSITAPLLATNAITLGYTQITGDVTLTTPTTDTLVTGLTVTVTIPAGGRKVKITVFAANVSTNNTNATVQFSIWDGTVGSGTELAYTVPVASGSVASDQHGSIVMAVVTPSAGSKTYNVGLKCTAGNGTVSAGTNHPAFILVEAI